MSVLIGIHLSHICTWWTHNMALFDAATWVSMYSTYNCGCHFLCTLAPSEWPAQHEFRFCQAIRFPAHMYRPHHVDKLSLNIQLLVTYHLKNWTKFPERHAQHLSKFWVHLCWTCWHIWSKNQALGLFLQGRCWRPSWKIHEYWWMNEEGGVVRSSEEDNKWIGKRCIISTWGF